MSKITLESLVKRVEALESALMAKNANGRAKQPNKNGVARRKRMPKWKRRLEEYKPEDVVIITFASEADIDAGTALIWGGKLTGAPFDLNPNGLSFYVPKATLPYFTAAGIKFTHKPAYPNVTR